MSEKRSDIDIHIGARMRQRRNDIEMTQQQLGQATGVTFQQIQKYEKGANAVSAARLLDVARALRCDLAYFFDGLSARARPGLAEGPAPDYVAEGPQSAESLQLGRAFRRIRDPKVRKRVVALVASLAEEAAEAPDDSPDRSL